MNINIIAAPKVTVVAATQFFGHPDYPIPEDGSPAVKTCSFAAKGCYDSYGVDGNPNEDNQARIVEMRHGSVLEHFVVSLFIEGVTRGLTLELNRHRHYAISQRSTRYTNEDEANFVLEPYYADIYNRSGGDVATGPELQMLEEFLDQCREAQNTYVRQVNWLMEINPHELTGTNLRKWARGKARNILPHALETRGTWTGNIRAWRHFLEMRSERYAEEEIRRLSNVAFAALRSYIGFYLSDYEAEFVQGWQEYQTEHRKV